MASLTDHVRRHYEDQGLSEERLGELRAIARSGATGRARSRSWLRYGMAAAVLVTATIGVFLAFPRSAVAERVIREIAMKHNKALDMEFRVSCCEDLCECMSKLDCRPVTPERIRERGLRVVGARYCSVEGELAAQIRLEDEKGRRYTLYQCRCTPDLEKIEEASDTVNGVRVEVWREAGLFMGLAGPGE
jgi:hypothetical protein